MSDKEILVQIEVLVSEANDKLREAYKLAADNQIIISTDLNYNSLITIQNHDWDPSGDWDSSSC